MNVQVKTERIWNGDEITKDMKKELMEGFYSAGERIVAGAKSRIKRSDKPITDKHPGHLQDTIRVRKARKKKYIPGAFVFAGDMRKGIYWHYMVEYGTYFEPAHPYMRPAVDSNFNAVQAEAARAGKRVINKKRRERKRR